MATMYEAMKEWQRQGAWVVLKDGRVVKLEDFWKEIYDKDKVDWEALYRTEV